MDDSPIEQAYSFLCRGCDHAWSAGYEIRRVHDSRGLVQSAFFLDGHRTPSPLTQGRCVRCGGGHVQVTPHTRGRRPRGGAMMGMTP
ncbi:hypothetical protein GCM10009839_74350 [Catenulispora yoronensis]|uniref:Uncharacterized protein n=1 Tax=Catenulispora yoronensis TaxID=450799 RepID=A0ABP5GU59_9ACTN